MSNLYTDLSNIIQQANANGTLYNRPDDRLCTFSFALTVLYSNYDTDHAIEVTKSNLSIWHKIKMSYENFGGIDQPCPRECFMTVEYLNRVLRFLETVKEMVDYMATSAETAETYQEELV